jgi:hypothetical protein
MSTLTGSCLCGRVRFEVETPFEKITACHCTTCKKLSGGGGTVNGRARTDAIRIVSGDELLTTIQPEEGTGKTFCSACGSNIFGGGWPDSEFSSVRLPTLDEPFEGKVDRHIFVRSLAPWETLPDDGAERHAARAP